MKMTTHLTDRAPLSRRSGWSSLSHGPYGAFLWWTALTKVEEALVVVKGIVSKGVPGGRNGVGVEISRVSVAGVGGAVCRVQGVRVHHDLGCLICVHAGGRCRCGGGPSEPSTSTTATAAAAPSSRRLLGALRSGPACGSAGRGQHGHQYHEKGAQEYDANRSHTEGVTP